jgi:acetyltransferase-like isoleucine patch superfamily enzyme
MLTGAHIGKGVHIAPHVVINCEKMQRLMIKDNCSLGFRVWIRCESIEMDTDVKIAGGVGIYGKGKVTLGKAVYIGQNAFLDCWETILLERQVQMGPGSMLLTHDSSQSYITGDKIKSGPIIIRENAYIGAGAIILPGVEIGKSAIIGAGAVVTHNVPNNTVVTGIPAKAVRSNLTPGGT